MLKEYIILEILSKYTKYFKVDEIGATPQYQGQNATTLDTFSTSVFIL